MRNIPQIRISWTDWVESYSNSSRHHAKMGRTKDMNKIEHIWISFQIQACLLHYQSFCRIDKFNHHKMVVMLQLEVYWYAKWLKKLQIRFYLQESLYSISLLWPQRHWTKKKLMMWWKKLNYCLNQSQSMVGEWSSIS